jgi:peptidyl-prolyl cis-trans isomerase D
MLQDIGDKLKSHRWLGFILLGALALIFAMWGAYGVVDLTFGAPSWALKVNGEEIPAATMQDNYRQRLSALQQQLKDEVPLAQRRSLQEQLVDDSVASTLLRQRATERGLRVSEDDVTNAYKAQSAFLVDGKFNAVVAQSLLKQNGTTPAQFEASLRNGMQTTQLAEALQMSDFLTDRELQRAFALENEQRELRFVVLPAGRFESTAAVDDAQLQAWYAAHTDDYQSAESVKLQYGELTLASVAAGVAVDEAALTAWYGKNQTRYAQPERRRSRHVLIEVGTTADAAATEVELKKAQDVLAQAKAGKDFAALAKQYSDDAGSKDKGGDVGWTRKGQLLQAYDDALFAMQAGQISAVVKSDAGYHIIKLDAIDTPAGKSLANARAEIEQDYRKDLAADKFGDRQEQLQQRIETAGDTDLAAVARDFGLTTGEVAAYGKAGAAPLGNSADLNSLLFSAEPLGVGRMGGPVALGDERLVIVKVLERHAAATQPLSEVRAEVLAAIRADAAAKAAYAAALAAAKRLQAGEVFDVVIKGLGLTAAPARLVSRGDPQLPAQVRDAAFALAAASGKAAASAVATDDGGAAVVLVSDVRAGTGGVNSTNDQQLAEQLLRRHREAELAAYQAELKRQATIKRNDTVFE